MFESVITGEYALHSGFYADCKYLKLSEDDIDELRQNVVAAVLAQKQKWQKHLKEIVRNEAMALKRGTHQMMSLSEIDENSLLYNDGPRSEPDIFEKSALAAKVQEVIESLPEPKRSLCELLKYTSPESARRKLGITQREFQMLCDELKVVFIAAGLEP